MYQYDLIGPKRGVALYSYSAEYGMSKDLEDCLEDMYDMGAQDRDTFWAVTDKAVLYVKKEGGLVQGLHHIKYGFSYSSSYMPPIMQNDDALDLDKEAMIFLPEFGHHVNERRLIIV